MSMQRKLLFTVSIVLALLVASIPSAAQSRPRFDPDGDHDRDKIQTMWIDHLVFLPGDPSVQTSFNAVNSGVGGGLSGLIITSSTLGDEADGGGNKVVETALEVPPGFDIVSVRVCYENSNPRSFITQTRLAQVQNPPSTALVLLDDPTHLNAAGPVCVNSQPTLVNPAKGSVLLSLRVNFGDTTDKIVLRAVGLNLVK
ncbi:MAG TPA: hypothetical protein VK699_09535 [Terriglobales bacterium]|jgi:hypothetical protein|nr:hypothetical protein [Terriglobales bacterium]